MKVGQTIISSVRFESAGYFTLTVFLVYCDSQCSVDLPHNFVGLSAVCNCGI